MEGLIVFLVAISILLAIFNAASMFVLGSAFMKDRELLETIIVLLKKRITRGRRFTPDDNLMEITNTQYPFDRPPETP